MKHIITLCLVLLSVVGQAESIHFRVISKIKQVDLKDVGGKIEGNGQQISIDGAFLKFSNHDKAFDIKEKAYEEVKGDSYLTFVYYDHRRKYYATVLFDKNSEVIIIITDGSGSGYLYYCEVI